MGFQRSTLSTILSADVAHYPMTFPNRVLLSSSHVHLTMNNPHLIGRRSPETSMYDLRCYIRSNTEHLSAAPAKQSTKPALGRGK